MHPGAKQNVARGEKREETALQPGTIPHRLCLQCRREPHSRRPAPSKRFVRLHIQLLEFHNSLARMTGAGREEGAGEWKQWRVRDRNRESEAEGCGRDREVCLHKRAHSGQCRRWDRILGLKLGHRPPVHSPVSLLHLPHALASLLHWARHRRTVQTRQWRRESLCQGQVQARPALR